MRTGLAADSRVTREYQHTNRRVTISPTTRASPPTAFDGLLIDEKIETSVPSPIDIFTAISTTVVSGAGTTGARLMADRNPGIRSGTMVRCSHLHPLQGSPEITIVAVEAWMGIRWKAGRCQPERLAALIEHNLVTVFRHRSLFMDQPHLVSLLCHLPVAHGAANN